MIETLQHRIDQLIAERDAAKAKLVEVQKAIAWNCAVCSYPMKRIEENRWECWHCMEIASLDARIDILKNALGIAEDALNQVSSNLWVGNKSHMTMEISEAIAEINKLKGIQ